MGKLIFRKLVNESESGNQSKKEYKREKNGGRREQCFRSQVQNGQLAIKY